MKRNSRTSIVLATLCPITTILLFPPLSMATPCSKISWNFSLRTFVYINEGLNGAEILCLQNRNEHGPYSNFQNKHSRFFYTTHMRFLDLEDVHRTFEYSFFKSSIPRGWIVSTCRRFFHFFHTLVDRTVTSRCTVAFAG